MAKVTDITCTSHCGRVGTCTALLSLGMPVELVNAHQGWGPNSDAAVTRYNRPGTHVSAFDADFFYGALPKYQ